VSKNRTISQPEASPRGERYHITTRSIGAADALQVPLVCFATFENHFCGHEQECAGVYRGTLSANNPLKFSEEVSFCGLHGRIVELRVEDIKITGECYRGSGFSTFSANVHGRLCSSSHTGHTARRFSR
jgi:hypothetical protein